MGVASQSPRVPSGLGGLVEAFCMWLSLMCIVVSPWSPKPVEICPDDCKHLWAPLRPTASETGGALIYGLVVCITINSVPVTWRGTKGLLNSHSYCQRVIYSSTDEFSSIQLYLYCAKWQHTLSQGPYNITEKRNSWASTWRLWRRIKLPLNRKKSLTQGDSVVGETSAVIGCGEIREMGAMLPLF